MAEVEADSEAATEEASVAEVATEEVSEVAIEEAEVASEEEALPLLTKIEPPFRNSKDPKYHSEAVLSQ